MSPPKNLSTIVGIEERVVTELLARIPEIMNGPECPGDGTCNCTKVCKLLADKNKVLDKVSKT